MKHLTYHQVIEEDDAFTLGR